MQLQRAPVIDEMTKRRIKDLIQNICEENEFVLAMFYAPQGLKKDDFLSCKDQAYYMKIDNEFIKSFHAESESLKHFMGKGNLGKAWDQNKTEWHRNVQIMPSDEYSRKYFAEDA